GRSGLFAHGVHYLAAAKRVRTRTHCRRRATCPPRRGTSFRCQSCEATRGAAPKAQGQAEACRRRLILGREQANRSGKSDKGCGSVEANHWEEWLPEKVKELKA